jgi:hypothetical protein
MAEPPRQSSPPFRPSDQIVSIAALIGKTYRARAFIDATYEGDLMATADVRYHVGREADSVQDKTWNGIQVSVL